MIIPPLSLTGPILTIRRFPRSFTLHELIGLGLSHLVFVGASRDVDHTVRERSDHLLATEVLPAVRAALPAAPDASAE